jgi:hypothetical protein
MRMLLIHGARAVMRHSLNSQKSPLREWAYQKHTEKGGGKAIVALANKTTRHMWNVMAEAA